MDRPDRDDRGISDVCEHALDVVCLLTDPGRVSPQTDPPAWSDRHHPRLLPSLIDPPLVRSGQIHGPGSPFVAP